MDWRQLWEIMSAADNVPIIALIPLLAFYISRLAQAHANDLLIAQLEGDAALAKRITAKRGPSSPAGKKKSTSGRSFFASNFSPPSLSLSS